MIFLSVSFSFLFAERDVPWPRSRGQRFSSSVADPVDPWIFEPGSGAVFLSLEPAFKCLDLLKLKECIIITKKNTINANKIRN